MPRCGFIFFSGLILLALICSSLSARAAEEDNSGIADLVKLLADIDDADFQLDLLKGILDGIKGRRDLKMPKAWPAAYAKLSKSKSVEVRSRARVLALAFGDPAALAGLRKVLMDKTAKPDARRSALASLVESGAKDLAPALHKLLDEAAMRSVALRALATYPHRKTPGLIVGRYAAFSASEKQDAIGTLASRAVFARALLAAVEAKQIPAKDISAFTARQLLALGDEQVSARLGKVWGKIRKSSGAAAKLIAQYKKVYTPGFLKAADTSHGRLVFKKTCSQCHTLYGDGGKIGPDLTGSNRKNLDYVLQNALDPSAAVGNAYQMTTIITTAGRVISGIVQEKTGSALTIQTANERVVLSLDDIEESKLSTVSMMPDGLLQKLSKEEVRDLIVYLATSDQVPLPDGAEESAP
jgi:putative heme-binding domain-containing protein